MEKVNFISVNVRGLNTDEKRKKKYIHGFLKRKKILHFCKKHILFKNMNVNTTLVGKGELFMHIVIQYLVEV